MTRVRVTKRLISATRADGSRVTLEGPVEGELVDDDGLRIVVQTDAGEKIETNWLCAVTI